MASKKELQVVMNLRDLVSRNLMVIRRNFRRMARFSKNAIRGVVRTVFSLKSALLGMVATLATKSFINAASTMETYKMQLLAVVGNVKKANVIFQELREFAAQSPVETDDLINAFVQLKRIGIPSLDATIKKIAEVALVSNKSVAETAQAFVSLESEVLRKLGIEMKRTATKAVLSAGEGAKRMILEVDNTSRAIRDALLKIWTKQLPDAMALAEQTFKGKLAAFKGLVWDTMADIGDIFLPKLKEWLDKASEFLEEHRDEIITYFAMIPDILSALANRILKIFEIIGKGFSFLLPKSLTRDIPKAIGQIKGELSELSPFLEELKKLQTKRQGLIRMKLEVNTEDFAKNLKMFENQYVPAINKITKNLSNKLFTSKERSATIDRVSKELEKFKTFSRETTELFIKLSKAGKVSADSAHEILTPIYKFQVKLQELYSQVSKPPTNFEKFSAGFVSELKKIVKGFQNMESAGKKAAHNLTHGVKNSFATMFKDIIRGTKSVEDAFVDMGNRILDVFAQIAAEYAAEQAIVYTGKGLSGIGFSKIGDFLSNFNKVTPTPLAKGGIVKSPTLAMIGEGQHSEAVVPLPDGSSIPVQMKGGNKGGVTINPVIVVQAVDARDVIKHEKAIISMITKSLRTNSALRGVLQSYV